MFGIVLLASFILSISVPDSLETNYDLGRYYFIIERTTAAEFTAIDTVHALAVRDSSAAGRIHFTYKDSSISDSIRYHYRARMYVPSNPDAGAWTKFSEPSGIVSGLLFDWSQDVEEPKRYFSYYLDELLVLWLPTNGWLYTWTYYQGSDVVRAEYRFDFDLDGILTLSDLGVFGDSYGSLYNLSDFCEFADAYMLQTIFDYCSEGE